MGLVGLVIGKPGRRLPVSAGGIVAKTYADFQAHIAGLASISWDASTAEFGQTDYRTTCAAPIGTMTGSSWVSHYKSSDVLTTVARTVQHAFVTQPVFDAQVAAGREVAITRVTQTGRTDFIGRSRNGFASTELIGTEPGQRITLMRYFDPTLGPMQVNPFAGTGPTPYIW